MRGVNDDEVADFVELTRQQAVNVRFIEYMPFDGNVWATHKMVPYRELVAAVQERCVGRWRVCVCACVGGGGSTCVLALPPFLCLALPCWR
jgi:hypothetical protein